MALEGMDVEAVEAIAGNLTKAGDSIDGITKAINALVANAEQNWKGPDATQFQNAWETQHKPALTAAKADIEGLGTNAKAQAAAQKAASAN